MKISEFLKSPKTSSALLFTIEPVEGDETKVLISPWIENGGCSCDSSLEVAKELIEEVDPIGKDHLCCGELHPVVKITFAEGASIPIQNVFEGLVKKANDSLKKKSKTNPNIKSVQHHLLRRQNYLAPIICIDGICTEPEEPGFDQPGGCRHPAKYNKCLHDCLASGKDIQHCASPCSTLYC